MGMSKGQNQYGQAFRLKIKELQATGLSYRQIASELGAELNVIRKAVERENKRQRQAIVGKLPKAQGRPRTKPMTTLEELQIATRSWRLKNQNFKIKDK